MNTLLIVSLVIMLGQQGSAFYKQVQLDAISKCPSDVSLLVPLISVDSQSICAVRCAISDICAVMHFSTITLRCYHGDIKQFATLWNRKSDSWVHAFECTSYAKPSAIKIISSDYLNSTPATVTHTAVTTILAETSPTGGISALLSKLVIFYDFRQGYVNLANPSKFLAMPQGSITRDTQGARFSGSPTDYIEVNTEGNSLASNYLDYSNNFTFFVRVVRQTYNQQTYHYFHDCSGNWRGEFYDQRSLWVKHAFSNQTSLFDQTETIQTNSDMVPADNQPSNVSAAVTFNGIRFRSFYFNQNAVAGSSDKNYAFMGLPLCLRLGYNPNAASALKGLYICYGIAKVALSLNEFNALSRYCAG